MKTFAILSALTALVAAAPFPTGTSGFPAPSGTAPACSPPGTGFPLAPTGGAFPLLNGTHGHGHKHGHHPSGYAHPTGTAPAALPTGTAAPYKREAHLDDLTAFSQPSFSLPTEAASSGIPFPTGSLGAGISRLAAGLASASGSGFARPTGRLPLPTGLSSAAAAAASGLSEFEFERRKAQYGGLPSFSFFAGPTATVGAAAPTGTSGRDIPGGSRLRGTGVSAGTHSGVAHPTGGPAAY